MFQCGQSLESVATAFSVLEGERNGVLQKLLEASCGVEQSWSANSKHDDTTTSSSSSGGELVSLTWKNGPNVNNFVGQNGDHSKVPPAVSESDAYRSLLLQSSLVLSGELTSDEAGENGEWVSNLPLHCPYTQTLILSKKCTSFPPQRLHHLSTILCWYPLTSKLLSQEHQLSLTVTWALHHRYHHQVLYRCQKLQPAKLKWCKLQYFTPPVGIIIVSL